MRISDWSSDVCSSDLQGGSAGIQPGLVDCAATLLLGVGSGSVNGFFGVALGFCAGGIGAFRIRRLRDRVRADRKRVVSGKSVSVRVDLGGRRIIKKKQQTTS